MVRWVGRAVAAFFRPKASLVAENLCLREQILILQRRHPRPRLRDNDRRFRDGTERAGKPIGAGALDAENDRDEKPFRRT